MKDEEPKDLFKNMKEVLEARWAEDAKICKIEEGGISLFDEIGNKYDIDWIDCDTHEKIIKWVDHLLPKDWITKRHVRLVILHACTHHNIVPRANI